MQYMQSESIRTALIVLSYNGIETTKLFMQNLDKNTDQNNIFLIMIDNGSSDGSAEYLTEENKNRNNMVYVSSTSNLGVIGGRNYAFNMYKNLPNKPEYLMILDNDQYVQRGWLEHHHSVLQETKSTVVGVEAWLMNSRFYPIRRATRPNDPWTYIGCGGMLMRGEVPERLGLFDDRFNPAYFEDPDYCFRIMDDGGKLAWNYKSRIIHFPHQTLGKNSKKIDIFKNSYTEFCSKWKNRNFRPQHQVLVDSLKK